MQSTRTVADDGLVDTNVLGRLVHPADPQYGIALEALAIARRRGYRPAIVPQVLYEFWVVATRPADQNGLAMSAVEAEADLIKCMQLFDFYRDERAIFDRWHDLIVQHDVRGKPSHDARLVAAMKRHGIAHLLTFNDNDFARYDDITVVNPKSAESLARIS